jgi:hypothetical protein
MPTHPGVNSIFDLDHFPLGERQAIMRLAQQFYITRAAKSVAMGNSSYRAFLMRPTDGMSAVLNVEREIVAMFANYDTFEARTLNAFERVYDQFDDVRVDRSIRFLISLDPNIENTIRHYLAQNLEYPIVVPFKYSDFRSPNDDFIFNAIRRNYLIRDLFGYQSPLTQEYFFSGGRNCSKACSIVTNPGRIVGYSGCERAERLRRSMPYNVALKHPSAERSL